MSKVRRIHLRDWWFEDTEYRFNDAEIRVNAGKGQTVVVLHLDRNGLVCLAEQLHDIRRAWEGDMDELRESLRGEAEKSG